MVMSGLCIKAVKPATTSRRLWGGILVAIPTAIPAAPFTSRCGTLAGSTVGSSCDQAGWHHTQRALQLDVFALKVAQETAGRKTQIVLSGLMALTERYGQHCHSKSHVAYLRSVEIGQKVDCV